MGEPKLTRWETGATPGLRSSPFRRPQQAQSSTALFRFRNAQAGSLCHYGCTCTRKNCARLAFVPVKFIVALFVACNHGVTFVHAARFVAAFT